MITPKCKKKISREFRIHKPRTSSRCRNFKHDVLITYLIKLIFPYHLL